MMFMNEDKVRALVAVEVSGQVTRTVKTLESRAQNELNEFIKNVNAKLILIENDNNKFRKEIMEWQDKNHARWTEDRVHIRQHANQVEGYLKSLNVILRSLSKSLRYKK